MGPVIVTGINYFQEGSRQQYQVITSNCQGSKINTSTMYNRKYYHQYNHKTTNLSMNNKNKVIYNQKTSFRIWMTRANATGKDQHNRKKKGLLIIAHSLNTTMTSTCKINQVTISSHLNTRTISRRSVGEVAHLTTEINQSKPVNRLAGWHRIKQIISASNQVIVSGLIIKTKHKTINPNVRDQPRGRLRQRIKIKMIKMSMRVRLGSRTQLKIIKINSKTKLKTIKIKQRVKLKITRIKQKSLLMIHNKIIK